MRTERITDWLAKHPTIAGFVFLGGVYLSKGLEFGTQSAAGGYKGP